MSKHLLLFSYMKSCPFPVHPKDLQYHVRLSRGKGKLDCKKSTTRGIPRRSPIQVLTPPDAA